MMNKLMNPTTWTTALCVLIACVLQSPIAAEPKGKLLIRAGEYRGGLPNYTGNLDRDLAGVDIDEFLTINIVRKSATEITGTVRWHDYRSDLKATLAKPYGDSESFAGSFVTNNGTWYPIECAVVHFANGVYLRVETLLIHDTEVVDRTADQRRRLREAQRALQDHKDGKKVLDERTFKDVDGDYARLYEVLRDTYYLRLPAEKK